MLDHFLHIAQSMPEFCLFTILYTSLHCNLTSESRQRAAPIRPVAYPASHASVIQPSSDLENLMK